MRESLLTIPVSEAFEPREGCPFCLMRNTVEEHICEYIMGAAMMESDVRIETNALGFCHHHYGDLLKQGNRLSLGLMLKSHLETVNENIFAKKGILNALKKNKRTEKTEKYGETCFVCEKVNWGMNHMVKTFYTLFKTEKEFKRLFAVQEYVCMPHYAWIRGKAADHLTKGDLTEFLTALDTLTENYITKLSGDVSQFCDSFDYRNAGKLHTPEMEHVRTSVNRSIGFLTGRNVGS